MPDVNENADKIYVSSFPVFLNTDALIVEYDDVLVIPEFELICLLRVENFLDEFFDFSEIRQIETVEEITEWYMNRKYKEIFCNFPPLERTMNYITRTYTNNGISEIDALKLFSNDLVENCIQTVYAVTEDDVRLNFFEVLNQIADQDLVKKIIVFTKYTDETAKIIFDKISSDLNERIIYTNLSLPELIDTYEITNNSTFVFSDVNHIDEVHEKKLLHLSSILLSNGYKYNMNSDGGLALDLEKYLEDSIFKLDFFENYYT